MSAPNDPTAPEPPEEPRTRIIRRAPTEPLPTVSDSAQPTQIIRRAPSSEATKDVDPIPELPGLSQPSARTAVAAGAVSIVSGWATSVVATDLIAGWWQTDRLFCIAVGFLALVFAITTVSGVIMLLLHRAVGRQLIAAGAVVALLTYLGVFIAGARVAWVVHALPLLPVACVVLVMLPETRRWTD